jgi:hypothetical protein
MRARTHTRLTVGLGEGEADRVWRVRASVVAAAAAMMCVRDAHSTRSKMVAEVRGLSIA